MKGAGQLPKTSPLFWNRDCLSSRPTQGDRSGANHGPRAGLVARALTSGNGTGATQWAHTRGMRSRGTGTTRALPGSPFNQPPAVAIVASYAMSDRVSHDRYGLGTVVGTENGNAAVLVNFGPKVLRVALPTTKMVKL